jgi:hypothetical protein
LFSFFTCSTDLASTFSFLYRRLANHLLTIDCTSMMWRTFRRYLVLARKRRTYFWIIVACTHNHKCQYRYFIADILKSMVLPYLSDNEIHQCFRR